MLYVSGNNTPNPLKVDRLIMSEEDIKIVEVTIEELKESIELAEALKRLQSNPDFNKVINKGYLEDNAIRLVALRSSPSLQEKEQQESVLKEIDGIGALLNYFRRIMYMGEEAKADLVNEQETLDSLRGE